MQAEFACKLIFIKNFKNIIKIILILENVNIYLKLMKTDCKEKCFKNI